MGNCLCHSKTNKWNVKSLEDVHFIKVEKKERNFGEHSQIFRQVVSQGIVQLLELIKLVYVPNQSKLVGYNTDSVFIENPKKISFKDYPQYKPEGWKPKKYNFKFASDYEVKEPEKMKWENHDGMDVESLRGKSFVCCGCGGCGKTHLLCSLNCPNTLVLCATNKACDNLRQKGIKNVFTFDSYFQQNETISPDIKMIQVDEYSMMSTSWLKTIYGLKRRNPELIVQMYGDKNQCKAVCKLGRFFNYIEKKCFNFICGGLLVEKQYIEASARYDQELYEVATYLLETGYMHPKLKNQQINQQLKTNIVNRNITRDQINEKFAQEWTVDMKLISENNIKPKKIFNSKIYYIVALNEKDVCVSEELGGKALECGFVSRKLFRPAFAVTVYKYQGSTITENFNIFNTQTMDRNELYTALTRAQRLDQIHIEYCSKFYKSAVESEQSTNLKIEKCKVGFLYYMSNTENSVGYVGETTRDIETRFQEHKDDPEDSMHKYGGNWEVKEIAKVHYFDDKGRKIKHVEKMYTIKYQKQGLNLINKYNKLVPKVELAKKVSCGNYEKKLSQKFKIEKGPNYFRIQYTDENGKRVTVKKLFGKRQTEADVLKQMQEIQGEFISDVS